MAFLLRSLGLERAMRMATVSSRACLGKTGKSVASKTGKSGGTRGGTPWKRGCPFGSTTSAGVVAAAGDPGEPTVLVGPSLPVLSHSGKSVRASHWRSRGVNRLGRPTFGQSGMMGSMQSYHSYTTSSFCEKLHPIGSLRFPNRRDMVADDWDTPVAHLRKNPPFYRINDPHATSDARVKMLLRPHVRRLMRSLIMLVACNRKRGFDISPSLHLSNLAVSKTYHEFAIKNLNYHDASKPFLGYKVAGKLLADLLEAAGYVGCIEDLTDDIGYLFELLEDDIPDPNDKPLVYNAAFLDTQGRIGLTVRADSFLRNDRMLLKNKSGRHRFPKMSIRSSFINLPIQYLSRVPDHFPTDDMHPDFKLLRVRSKNLQEKMMEESNDGEQHGEQGEEQVQVVSNVEIDCLAKTGKWLTLMNRHGVMHPNKRTQRQTVDLLHGYTPLYLSYIQRVAEGWDWWDELNMQDFFPEDIAEFRCSKPMEEEHTSMDVSSHNSSVVNTGLITSRALVVVDQT